MLPSISILSIRLGSLSFYRQGVKNKEHETLAILDLVGSFCFVIFWHDFMLGKVSLANAKMKGHTNAEGRKTSCPKVNLLSQKT